MHHGPTHKMHLSGADMLFVFTLLGNILCDFTLTTIHKLLLQYFHKWQFHECISDNNKTRIMIIYRRTKCIEHMARHCSSRDGRDDGTSDRHRSAGRHQSRREGAGDDRQIPGTRTE